MKELEKDFYPFIAVGKNAPAGMTAHIVISAIDNRPVTQSENAIDEIIRKHIGFNGFLISDAIDMKALHGSLSEKTKNCLNAGCDAVCYCFGIEKELQEMVKILPPLTDMACERLARIRQIIQKKCTSFDYQKIYNQYNELARKVKEKSSDYDSVEILHKMEKNK